MAEQNHNTPNPNIPFELWNRLESRPRSNDFEQSLRAEIRDPLWMLSRQWQMGEFQAEDTGSAIVTNVRLAHTQIDRYVPQESTDIQYLNDSLPLEALVERMPVLNSGLSYEQLSLRAEMGRHWLKLLDKHVNTKSLAAVKQAYIEHTHLQFVMPASGQENATFFSNQKLWAFMAALIKGNTLDGGYLYEYIKIRTPIDFMISLSPSQTLISEVMAASDDFVAWFERVYAQSTEGQSAWDEKRLEYRFSTAASHTDGSSSILRSKEYHHGKLDWYAFDHDKNDPISIPNPDFGGSQVNTSLEQEEQFSFIPTEIQFPGMPNARWWEMEDHNVDLGGIQAETTELGKILLAEFALNYSNDWMVIPYEVPVGSLSEIKEIIVTDVFGQKTKIEAASTEANNDWQGWGLFYLKNKGITQDEDLRLFIPPVLSDSLESEPVEQVLFLRDELANQVWAVEQSVPDGFGNGVSGHEQALNIQTYLENLLGTNSLLNPLENDATIRYQIATSVLENWIPFIPVKKSGIGDREIQLQRAAMPRIVGNQAYGRVRPRTSLLRFGLDGNNPPSAPYYIHEEEVPRSGVQLTQSWQRCRWHNGEIITWLGRKKKIGKGEGSNGLIFDQVVEK